MAFDFPASPTDGQTSNGYTYSAASQCWLGGPAGGSGGGAAISVGDTPPAGPLDNQMWFESDTGITWIYYNDGNTKQWVAMTDAGGAYLPLTGGTLSGNLIVSVAGGPIISANTASGAPGGGFFVQQAGKHRWAIGATNAESSGNAGSDLQFASFNDAGSYLGAPIYINRATGVVTATGLPPAPTAIVGAGKWQTLSSASGGALNLPAGGTWAYLWMGFATAALTWTVAPTAGVNAGGTTIASATAGTTFGGICWRIA